LSSFLIKCWSFPANFYFPKMFFAHLKICNSDIALRKQFGIWYIVNYTYFSFHVRGIHHQTEKLNSFRSNYVNLIITIDFFTRKQNLIPHEPFFQPDKKTTTVKTTIMVFWMKPRFKMPSTFATNAYLAVSCWYKVVPPNGIYPLLLQCFITSKFESMYFLDHYRSCPYNEAHGSCPAALSYHFENTLRTGESNKSLCWTCWPISMMCLQKNLRIDSNSYPVLKLQQLAEDTLVQIWIIAKRSNACPFGGWFLESLQQT